MTWIKEARLSISSANRKFGGKRKIFWINQVRIREVEHRVIQKGDRKSDKEVEIQKREKREINLEKRKKFGKKGINSEKRNNFEKEKEFRKREII